MHQFSNMKFRYDPEKNSKLSNDESRNKIGFDEIANAMLEGNVLAITNHFNEEKYPNQKIAYVLILDQIYVVPYLEEGDDTIFLKTAYPSSKARELFLPDYKNSI